MYRYTFTAEEAGGLKRVEVRVIAQSEEEALLHAKKMIMRRFYNLDLVEEVELNAVDPGVVSGDCNCSPFFSGCRHIGDGGCKNNNECFKPNPCASNNCIWKKT